MPYIGSTGEYQFYVPESGGKAGKGCNKTSTIQVRKRGFVLKQVRFNVSCCISRTKAIKKARQWVARHVEACNFAKQASEKIQEGRAMNIFDDDRAGWAEQREAAKALLDAAKKALKYLEANRPKGDIRENFTALNQHENDAVSPLRLAIMKAEEVR